MEQRLTFRTLLLLGVLATTTTAGAQSGSVTVLRRALLKGTVVDDADEKPIAGATIEIEVLQMQAVTDSDGRFRVPNVPLGKHIVKVKRLGFSPLSAVLTFVNTDTTDYDFALVRQPTILPEASVVTTAPVPPKLLEFNERMKGGFGRYLTPDFLEKNRDRRLSEVIATLPGPRLVRGTGNYGWVASSVGAGSIERRGKLSAMDINRGADQKACYAAVILDGNIVYSGRPGEMLFDVNSLATNTVAAIEYYRGAANIPLKFNVTGGGESCGLIVIWTK